MHLPQYVYSKLFQQDIYFALSLWYIKQTVILIVYSFFMFYSLVDKCLMTQGQQFSIFWQQADHLEIYIVPTSTTNQVR